VNQPLLSLDELRVSFPLSGRRVPVIDGLSFDVGAGEMVGLVGESGCGKSLTALSILRLVPEPGAIDSGRILLAGTDLMTLPESELRRVRGGRIGLIFQEPMVALNPVFTIGFQIAEAIRVHRSVSRHEAWQRAAELLDLVAIPESRQRLRDYPHQLSGGQRQRAMIAMALAAEPELLIADEPTTALDVTVQAQILELLERLRRELSLAILLITHDLAVVAETCERVLVMYAGRLVEEAPVATLFASPAHPYTRGLLAAVPRLGKPAKRGCLATIPGQVPDPSRRPAGCAFHPRCPDVMERCSAGVPAIFPVGAGQRAACFLHDNGSPVA
jgi:oligopeptide/dipeptide ABC transporter ATP-binding protein